MSKKKFTLLTFLGIRPDIIRMQRLLALLDRGQRKFGYRHIFVHSGQHFDYQLEGIFYRQLGVRLPDSNLRVGRDLKKVNKGSHVEQAALLFIRTAATIEKFRPDAVLYLGDTNTVLTSLVVAKYGVPVIHIEGGGRSYDWRMPEEKNRIIVDHLSDVIYCYLDRYKQILLAEGIPEFRTVVVGNLIVDAIRNFLPAAARNPILKKLGVVAKSYALCTLHREEHLENRKILTTKLRELSKLARTLPVVFPVMPRLRSSIHKFNLRGLLDELNLNCTEPLGFLEFLNLEKNAALIITDSGTVQEEALVLGVPCLVARRSTERPETLAAGASLLAEDDLEKSALQALDLPRTWDRAVLNPLGGSPSERIFSDILEKIHSGYFLRSRKFEMLGAYPFVNEAYGLIPPRGRGSAPSHLTRAARAETRKSRRPMMRHSF
ncbi:MAG TPA: UDP-N-acetyl glucosamine 2-epimerase [Candidatus Acidoferrales bacterium]|nr:UDP-N-acetyl glucosamine 2-epimerase [Candidatus Acidoferrales bacterium]